MSAGAQTLRVLAADENPRALTEAATRLRRMGHDVVAMVGSPAEALERAEEVDPDVEAQARLEAIARRDGRRLADIAAEVVRAPR